MLDMKPFIYGTKIVNCFNGTTMFPPTCIEYAESGMWSSSALAMTLSHPSLLAFPQVIVDGFRNLVAVSIETNYDFKQAGEFKNSLYDAVQSNLPSEITLVIDNTEEAGDVDGDSDTDPGIEDPFLDFF